MSKITVPVQKPTNGGASKEEKAVLAVVNSVLNPEPGKPELIIPVLQIELQKLVIPAVEPKTLVLS